MFARHRRRRRDSAADRDELPALLRHRCSRSWSGPVAIHGQPRAHAAHPPPPAGPPHARGAVARDSARCCGNEVVPSLDTPGGREPVRPVRDPRRHRRRRRAGRDRPAGCRTAPPPGAEDLAFAVAAQLHQRISRLGKKLPTPFDLDDLIVDDDNPHRADRDRRGREASAAGSATRSSCAARRASRCLFSGPPRRRQDDVGHRAREAPRPRHLRGRSVAGRVEVARRDREEPVRRVRRRRARPRRAAVQRGRLAVRQAHLATSRAATIATPTWRPTTCCSASSASAASRS